MFTESKLFKFLDSAANVISLSVTVPSSELQQNGEVDSDKSQKNRSNMNKASVDGNNKDEDQPPPLMPKPKSRKATTAVLPLHFYFLLLIGLSFPLLWSCVSLLLKCVCI